MNFAEILKSIFLGIVEGLTEWLPISSTGHMILVNSFMKTDGFLTSDLYLYVIQFGAILAVVTMFFGKLNPFSPRKSSQEKKDTWDMWFKVIAACVPFSDCFSTTTWSISKIRMLSPPRLLYTVYCL